MLPERLECVTMFDIPKYCILQFKIGIWSNNLLLNYSIKLIVLYRVQIK